MTGEPTPTRPKPTKTWLIGLVALGGVVRVWAVLAHYRHLPLGFTDNLHGRVLL